MIRRACLTVDAAALGHNLQVARGAASGRSIFAAIKADGYGHSMFHAARAFSAAGAEGFAVATPEEGALLRKGGFAERILVLQGALTVDELSLAVEHSLEMVFHDCSQVDLLAHWQSVASEVLPGRLRAWINLDTGMHRAGLNPDQLASARRRLATCPRVDPAIGLMTHFGRADEPDPSFTNAQIATFRDLAVGWQGPTSLCNSAGLLGHDAGGDWARPGIMLYGGNPFIFGQSCDHDLRAGMHLKTVLVAVREVPRGGAIGYGGRFVAPERMPVGVASVGYGDGYPRHAPDGTPIRVNGQATTLIGRVSMDMITVDLRGIDARVGDEVECWGDRQPIDAVAQAAGTISYELMCQVSGQLRDEVRVIGLPAG